MSEQLINRIKSIIISLERDLEDKLTYHVAHHYSDKLHEIKVKLIDVGYDWTDEIGEFVIYQYNDRNIDRELEKVLKNMEKEFKYILNKLESDKIESTESIAELQKIEREQNATNPQKEQTNLGKVIQHIKKHPRSLFTHGGFGLMQLAFGKLVFILLIIFNQAFDSIVYFTLLFISIFLILIGIVLLLSIMNKKLHG